MTEKESEGPTLSFLFSCFLVEEGNENHQTKKDFSSLTNP